MDAPASEAVGRLANLVQNAEAGIAFTGAGISTESGIADFRSPGGVWSRHTPVMYNDFMRLRSERVRYWRMRAELYRDTVDAKPNDGHVAIARLEALGHVAAVVTQNIDGLHQDAGSGRVLELHGTNRIVACQKCGSEWAPPEILERIEIGDDAPDCDSCGGPLKSKTISFGQAMPERLMGDAAQLSMEADLYMAIGTSLVVEPAASLPRLAKDAGATLVIINKTATPLDRLADLVIREPIGETFRSLFARMGWSLGLTES